MIEYRGRRNSGIFSSALFAIAAMSFGLGLPSCQGRIDEGVQPKQGSSQKGLETARQLRGHPNLSARLPPQELEGAFVLDDSTVVPLPDSVINRVVRVARMRLPQGHVTIQDSSNYGAERCPIPYPEQELPDLCVDCHTTYAPTITADSDF